METVYQVIILVLLIIGCVSMILFKTFARNYPPGGVIGGHYASYPGHSQERSSGAGWLIALLLIIMFIVLYKGVDGESKGLPFKLPDFSPPTSQVLESRLPKSGVVSEAYNLHQDDSDEERIWSDEDLAQFEDASMLPSPQKQDLSEVAELTYAWQLNAFASWESANSFALSVLSRYPDVGIVTTSHSSAPYKVVCAVRSTREEVVQWSHQHQEVRGFVFTVVGE